MAPARQTSLCRCLHGTRKPRGAAGWGCERRRGARAGARCRPCRQEAQHANSARVELQRPAGSPLPSPPPMHCRPPLGLAAGRGQVVFVRSDAALSCRKHYAQQLGGPSGYPPSASRCLSSPSKNGTFGKWKRKAGEAKRGSHLPHTSPSLSAGKVVCTGHSLILPANLRCRTGFPDTVSPSRVETVPSSREKR